MMNSITTCTCVYAPNEHTEKMARECLRRVRAAVGPGTLVLAGIDLASAEFEKVLQADGVETFRMDGGAPPRMRQLLQRAAGRCKTPYFLTIENDVWVKPGLAMNLFDLIERSAPTVACVEARYCDRNGSPEYPTSSWTRGRRDGVAGVRLQDDYANWGCTLWRVEALRKLRWGKIPRLRNSDIVAGKQLKEMGYCFGVASDVFALHHCMQSFRARMAVAREKSQMKKRGVVVTALYGGKDWLREPRACDPDLDYHCFTDDPELTSSAWTIHVRDSQYATPMLAAKEYKVFPYRFFPEAEVIVWQDASFTQRRPYAPLIHKYLCADKPIAFFKHQCGRTTIKAEVAASEQHDVESSKRCRALLRHAWKHGFKASRPLVECGLNFRLNTPAVYGLMNLWWQYIIGWTHQDQISLPLCAFLLDMSYGVITESRNGYARLGKHLVPSRGQWRDWNEELPEVGDPEKGVASERTVLTEDVAVAP